MSTCHILTGPLPRGPRAACRAAVRALGWLLLLFLPVCHGIEMGQPEVFSSIGEPLDALVSLAGAGGVRSKGQCVVTTREAINAADGTPLAMHVRTRMELSGGSMALSITTRRAVQAPVVRLVIWIACVRQRAVSETLTLHLSSTGHASMRPAVSPDRGIKRAPTPSAMSLGEGIQQAAPPPALSSGQGVPQVPPRSAVSSGYDVQAEAVPVKPAPPPLRIAVPASASLPLKLSTVLSAPVPRPTAGQGAADGETPLAAARQGVASDGAEAAAAVAALQKEVEALEASRRRLLQQVQDLQVGTSRAHAVSGGESWAALLGYAAFGGALLVFVATIVRERRRGRPDPVPSRPIRAPRKNRPRRAGTRRSAGLPVDHEQARAVPPRPAPPAGDSQGSRAGSATDQEDLPLLVVAVEKPSAGDGAASRTSASVNVPLPSIDAADPGPANVFLLEEPQRGDGPGPSGDGESDEPGRGLDVELDGALGSFEQQVQEWDDAVGELHQALYEAELHLLHGSPAEAARILTEQVDSYDTEFPGMRPWTMLFDVYRQQGDETSFETLAARVRKRFNVAPPAWEILPSVGQATGMSLEDQFSHVVEHIMSLWPSSECLGYLNGLLMDDRGGVRQGFSLDVAEEIVLLRDVMRRRIGQGRDMRSQPAPPSPPEKRSQLN